MTTLLTYRNNIELTACIDEFDDSIEDSIKKLRDAGFKSASILNINGINASYLPDATLERIKRLLGDLKINVIRLDLGFGKEVDNKNIDRELAIASYFKAKAIQIGIDKSSFKSEAQLLDYASHISSNAISMSLVPALEMTNTMYYASAGELMMFLNAHKKFKLIYDPCRFMERINTNPHDKWFSQVKPSVYAIISRDFKTGSGYYPLGQGQTSVVKAIDEYILDNGRYVIFKPSLGRRYGSTVGKSETCKLALDVFNRFFKEISDA